MQARRIAADGTVGTVRDLSATGQDADGPQVAIAPNGVSTVTWSRNDGTNTIVQAVRIAADGDGIVGSVQDLSATGRNADAPQVAVDANGVSTVVWYRNDGTNTIVQAVRIAANGTVGTVQDLSATGQNATASQVAVDANGVSTVAWTRNTIVQAVRIAANGTVGTVQDLSVAGPSTRDPQVAGNASGTSMVTWQRSNGTKYIVQARRIDAADTIGDVHDLSAAGRDAANPKAAVSADGVSTVAWSRSNGTNTIVQVVRIDAADTIGDVHDLSAAGRDADAPRVAVDVNGVSTVAWYRSNDGINNIMQAARVAANGAVGAVQDLSAAGQSAYSPYVAVNPSRVATVAWFLDNGTNTVVQVSRYTPAPEFSVLPTSNDYGSRVIGAGPTAAQDFVVTNTGDATLNITAASLVGADTSQFIITADTCTGPAVDPEATCTVSATFDPSSTGAKTASLQFVDNTTSSPNTVALTGIGLADPVATPETPPAAAPVTPPAAAPANTAAPKISGKKKVKKQLKATNGRWTGTDPITFKYTWQRCDRRGKKCRSIKRATRASYRLTKNDLGHRLKVVVTAKNAAGTKTARSKTTTVVHR